jgi:excinuclease ABC subunit B
MLANKDFLRSQTSLIQIMGRAARHVNGQVIMYTDKVSDAMTGAIREVNRRRKIQEKYNQDNNITPISISKTIRPKIIDSLLVKEESPIGEGDFDSLLPNQKKKYIKSLKTQMHQFAADLDFENAIKIRNIIRKIE